MTYIAISKCNPEHRDNILEIIKCYVEGGEITNDRGRIFLNENLSQKEKAAIARILHIQIDGAAGAPGVINPLGVPALAPPANAPALPGQDGSPAATDQPILQ